MVSYNSFIQTHPFLNNTDASVADGEGLCYVPEDNTLWVADDNGRAIYEVDLSSGHFIQKIGLDFGSVVKIGGNELAGIDRYRDIEAIAYNHDEKALYVFSGESAEGLPTCFRLIRECNSFRLDSWQPLAMPFTGAAYNDGTIWATNGHSFYSYDYGTNSHSLSHTLDKAIYGKHIFGLGFVEGDSVWMVTNKDIAYLLSWPDFEPLGEVELTEFDIFDGRGADQIGNQLYIIDGYSYPPDPAKRSAIHILDLEVD